MSTYWGFRCNNHTPPLDSEHWYNHGEERLKVALKLQGSIVPEVLEYLDRASPELQWLAKHPGCYVTLVNEYGYEIKP